MLTVFTFSTLLFSTLSQPFGPYSDECCNYCTDQNTGQCTAPYYWPDYLVCQGYDQPFWPDNFCPNEYPEKGNCFCTQGYDDYLNSDGTLVTDVPQNICVRGLTSDQYTDTWGRGMCAQSNQCTPGQANQCQDGYYCVYACCNQLVPPLATNDNGYRCMPCCDEPVPVPTPDPTPPTPQPVEPTPRPTLPTPQPVEPTPRPTQPTPVPVDVQTCPCEENPQQCDDTFIWPQLCSDQYVGPETLECPTTGEVIEIYTQCACTYGFEDFATAPTDVCIRDPVEWFGDPNQVCRCLQECRPGESKCPPDHYCVDTCCPTTTGESTYRCMPCCDKEFQIWG